MSDFVDQYIAACHELQLSDAEAQALWLRLKAQVASAARWLQEHSDRSVQDAYRATNAIGMMELAQSIRRQRIPKSRAVLRPTVVIGLGGTGHDAVRKLKRRFIDAHGYVPPIIRFLSIDTTESAEGAARPDEAVLERDELCVLQVGALPARVNEAVPHVKEWWPESIPTEPIAAGTRQIRALGRLALFGKASQVYARISQALEDVRNISYQNQMYTDWSRTISDVAIDVIIVSSVAGGTGSGMLLDVAFMARDIIGDRHQSTLTGFLVLPSVFARHPGAGFVKANAYSALKEVEYLSTIKHSFQVDYGMRHVTVDRPPFDVVYLVDNINEHGYVLPGQDDLLDLIAGGIYMQMGSSVGTDKVRTGIATLGRVKGRSPQYCSFGVATMTLQSYDDYRYQAAMRLLSDDLLDDAVSDTAIQQDVQRFLDSIHARDGNLSSIEAALVVSDGRWPSFAKQLSDTELTNDALAKLRAQHALHRSLSEKQIALVTETTLEALCTRYVAALDDMWTTMVNSVHGLAYAKRFFERVEAELAGFQHLTETEAKRERAKLRTLEFKRSEDLIREAMTAFFGRQDKIKIASEDYVRLVDRETMLTVQVADLENAARIYSSLRTHSLSILQSCFQIRENLNGARERFAQQYRDAAKTQDKHAFEQVVPIDPEAYGLTISGEEFVRWYVDQQGGSLLRWSQVRAADVHADIQRFVDIRCASLRSLTIEDVLRRSPPGVVAQQLKRLDALAVPLWQYEVGRIPLVNQAVINEFYHYGVANANKTMLSEPRYRSGLPTGDANLSMVSTRDSRRIVLFKVKVGIPLFALADIENMERAYLEPNKMITSHIDRHWQDLPNLIPRAGDGDALRWFALAQAPEPFAIIRREGSWYSMKSRAGRRVDNNLVRLAQNRVLAFAAFEKNRDLIDEAEERIDSIVQREGMTRVLEVLREYTEALSSVRANSVEPQVGDQLEDEIRAIGQFIYQMKGQGRES